MRIKVKESYASRLTKGKWYDVLSKVDLKGECAGVFYAIEGDDGSWVDISEGFVEAKADAPGWMSWKSHLVESAEGSMVNRRVRIKNFIISSYDGKEGVIVKDNLDICQYEVKMDSGEILYPFKESFAHPQCELLPEIIIDAVNPPSGTQYICPMDLFGGAIIKGVRYKQCHNPSFYQPDLKTDATYNLPAEIVETWEKVQEDVFANGAKVAFDGDAAMIGGFWWSKQTIETFRDIPRETYDKIISRLSDGNAIEPELYKDDGKDIYNVGEVSFKTTHTI